MGEVIACVAAGCAAAALWTAAARRTLRAKRARVDAAREQLRLHLDGYAQVRGRPGEREARQMVDASGEICRRIQADYETTLRRPWYRIPGWLLGFSAGRERP